MTRQQRRNAQREQAKLGRMAFVAGLPASPRREAVVGVALLFRAKLSERSNPTRAGEAAAMAYALIEKSLHAQPPASPIVCRKGCSYCCHSFVGIIAPEAFRLAEAIRRGKPADRSIDQIRQRCEPLMGLAPGERIGRKLPCPLLVNEVCSVYADRPVVCRQATSLSLDACLDEFEDRGRQAPIPISPLHLAHAGNTHAALLGALKSLGLPSHAYELAAALDVVLSTPGAERRWLDGEDIFRTLPPVSRPSPELERAASRIAADIAG